MAMAVAGIASPAISRNRNSVKSTSGWVSAKASAPAAAIGIRMRERRISRGVGDHDGVGVEGVMKVVNESPQP